jgi:hypothetical protein
MGNTYENTGEIYFEIFFLMQWLVQRRVVLGIITELAEVHFQTDSFEVEFILHY